LFYDREVAEGERITHRSASSSSSRYKRCQRGVEVETRGSDRNSLKEERED